MVFVKVRETYDLHTTKNKMTVIGIHTPKPDIIKKNYPGLLMQCKSYRPYSCDVRIACASMLPLDPQGVGTADGDVAPEDIFNPILYKAMSNKGMSQLEARVNAICHAPGSQLADVNGQTATVDVDSTTNLSDEFNLYYGLLANTHDWKHANPQSGVSMSNLKPLVYEILYNVGDNGAGSAEVADPTFYFSTGSDADRVSVTKQAIVGAAHPMPFINCTMYSREAQNTGNTVAAAGFPGQLANNSVYTPWINVVCGCIIVPPSRLHELFYRMVVEWTIEFSQLRPISEIADWTGLALVGSSSHYQNYSYEATRAAITGTDETILSNDSCMVSSNVDVTKVM